MTYVACLWVKYHYAVHDYKLDKNKKHSMDGLNSRTKESGEIISILEDRTIEITHYKQQKIEA